MINNQIKENNLVDLVKLEGFMTNLRILSNKLQRKYPQDWNAFLNILVEKY